MLLDEGTRGAIDGLAKNGFIDGKTIVIDKFNAQGDISVGNSIAKEMVNARYDLLLTISTLSLQAVANANRNGKTVQVFGLVADPVVAGVGSVATIRQITRATWLALAAFFLYKMLSELRGQCFQI